jgi:cytidylate kinase
VLGPDDPLPLRPHRIIVSGTSGSGKTTVAGRIAAVLGLPHVELDALFHGPGWTPRPTFEADVHEFAAGPRWVTERDRRPDLPIVRLRNRAEVTRWLSGPLVAAPQHRHDRPDRS